MNDKEEMEEEENRVRPLDAGPSADNVGRYAHDLWFPLYQKLFYKKLSNSNSNMEFQNWKGKLNQGKLYQREVRRYECG